MFHRPRQMTNTIHSLPNADLADASVICFGVSGHAWIVSRLHRFGLGRTALALPIVMLYRASIDFTLLEIRTFPNMSVTA